MKPSWRVFALYSTWSEWTHKGTWESPGSRLPHGAGNPPAELLKRASLHPDLVETSPRSREKWHPVALSLLGLSGLATLSEVRILRSALPEICGGDTPVLTKGSQAVRAPSTMIIQRPSL